MLSLILVGIFGAVGAICRYLASVACLRMFGSHFGFGTLLVNIAGCFLLGMLMHILEMETLRIPAHWHTGLSAGFLGALTTFSTFGYQTIRHIEDGQWTLAAANVLANVVLGLLAAAGGLAVGRLAVA